MGKELIKEKIAKEETPSIDELSKGIALVLLAEWVAINDGKTRLESNEYMEEAQTLADFLHAIGYRLEKETPKELVDCLEKIKVRAKVICDGEDGAAFSVGLRNAIESPELEAYIDSQKKEVIKALRQYNMGKISSERCAEIIGINTFEFMELY